MSGITSIDGVFADGCHCGIKSDGKADLAYISVPDAVAVAGVFTQNQFVAPSVIFTRERVQNDTLRHIIINSGNANVGNGERGDIANLDIAKEAAELFSCPLSEIGVSSTGKIAKNIEIEPFRVGVDIFRSRGIQKNGSAAAQAILTTDLVQKEVFLTREIGGQLISVGGVGKGSGMIKPDMATTLSYFATDIDITHLPLQTIFKRAVDRSLNMVSVDNDTSTSDMSILFATGKKKIWLTPKNLADFESLVTDALKEMAKLIARDGEGARALVEVAVSGAASEGEARTVALNVVNSPLVKTAIHGADPNWGRILAAACKNPKIKLNPDTIELKINGIVLFANGEQVGADHDSLVAELKTDTIVVSLDLKSGSFSASAWGCDLGYGYIDINVTYT